MTNISFAITVCNEAYELERLLTQLGDALIQGDEIVVQVDNDGSTQEVLDVLTAANGKITNKVYFSLNKDFAAFKNNVKKHCSKEYIFFIDADEEVNTQQIELTRQILELNPTVDCFLVPRVNTVEGLTERHILQWGWKVDEENRINFPDYQYRICKNKEEIKWVGKVHEKLEGSKQMALLPAEPVLALGHHKTIQKQEKQNGFYDTI